MTLRFRIVLCVLVLSSLQGLNVAQATSWRGWPLPQTDTFLITELGASLRTSDPPLTESRWLILTDVGGMRNLNRKWAMGGTICGAHDDTGWRLGVAPRARLWLKPDARHFPLSLDLSASVFLLGKTNRGEYRSPPAFAVAASLNGGDLLALTVRMEALRLEEAATDWGLSGGLRLGSWLAPAAAAVSLGAALIVAASGHGGF